jgi:hypothetical protein
MESRIILKESWNSKFLYTIIREVVILVWPVKRMDSIRIPRWALEFKFERERPMGRPKTRQLSQVPEDNRKKELAAEEKNLLLKLSLYLMLSVQT